jgi:hypothetical protein
MAYATINGKLTKVVKQKKQDIDLSFEEWYETKMSDLMGKDMFALDKNTFEIVRANYLKFTWDSGSAAMVELANGPDWDGVYPEGTKGYADFEEWMLEMDAYYGVKFPRLQ